MKHFTESLFLVTLNTVSYNFVKEAQNQHYIVIIIINILIQMVSQEYIIKTQIQRQACCASCRRRLF